MQKQQGSGKRRLTGMEYRMQEPYGEGVASNTGPESCVRDGNVGSESVRTRRKH